MRWMMLRNASLSLTPTVMVWYLGTNTIWSCMVILWKWMQMLFLTTQRRSLSDLYVAWWFINISYYGTAKKSVAWSIKNCFIHSQLHAKEKRRFDFADMDGSAGLNLTEFLAFTHPSEVDHMAVSIKWSCNKSQIFDLILNIHAWQNVLCGCIFPRTLLLKTCLLNMTWIKMDSSAWVNSLEISEQMVWLCLDK